MDEKKIDEEAQAETFGKILNVLLNNRKTGVVGLGFGMCVMKILLILIGAALYGRMTVLQERRIKELKKNLLTMPCCKRLFKNHFSNPKNME